MIFMKIPILLFLKKPMDNGKILKDGKRLFGDNKTWKGFLGMIIFSSLFLELQWILYVNFNFAKKISLIDFKNINPLLCGAFWGLGYVLAELPNSFIKRRMNVPPGKNVSGIRGKIHTFFDQSDSVIGCLIFMEFFYKASFRELFILFIFATSIHYIVNIGLYLSGLKKQAG